MSDLVVVAFEGEGTADQFRVKLEQLQKEHVISLDDLVVVVRGQDGKPKIKQSVSLAGMGALSGSFWGFLIGLIFFMPWLGLAIGAITGAISGKLSDYGIDDKFIKEVAEKVKPGDSAIFMLVRESTPDKVLERIDVKGHVIQTSLSNEAEARLREAFGDTSEESAEESE